MVRSVHTEGQAHGEALLRLHTGEANLVRPSVGAWVSYGLGCESDNLPAFITISPPRGHGGVQNYLATADAYRMGDRGGYEASPQGAAAFYHHRLACKPEVEQQVREGMAAVLQDLKTA